MKIILENSSPGANGVWITKVDPQRLIRLLNPIHQGGKVNIILIDSPLFDENTHSLYFDVDSAILLNSGNTSEAILIDLCVFEKGLHQPATPSNLQLEWEEDLNRLSKVGYLFSYSSHINPISGNKLFQVNVYTEDDTYIAVAKPTMNEAVKELIQILSVNFRELGITAAQRSQWREKFLQADQAALKKEPKDNKDVEIVQLRKKLGEVTMEYELLHQKVDRLKSGRPLRWRRSRK
jgi:hypothetical protein